MAWGARVNELGAKVGINNISVPPMSSLRSKLTCFVGEAIVVAVGAVDPFAVGVRVRLALLT